MDAIFEKALAGQPVTDCKIIDCHNHLGLYFNFSLPRYTASDMIAIMDRFGVNTVCIAPNMTCIGSDYEKGNTEMLEALEAYPDRFLGYVCINPYYRGEMEAESQRCMAKKGVIGYKLHPGFSNAPMDHPAYCDACARAGKRHQPILFHVWGIADVAMIKKLSELYPDTIFIMGHAGADFDGMTMACDVARTHPNVYIDTALSIAYQGNAEFLAEGAGADKLLYGTDLPFFDMSHVFGKVALSSLSESEKRMVLGGNMQRILDNIR